MEGEDADRKTDRLTDTQIKNASALPPVIKLFTLSFSFDFYYFEFIIIIIIIVRKKYNTNNNYYY